MAELTGRIFDIQRHCTEDGPGIRTTVFFKGCVMHCPWCHNPESIKAPPQLVWHENKCIGTLHCIEACPVHALSMTEAGIAIDRSLCTTCGKCALACPADALEILGKDYTLQDVLATALRDKVFYKNSGGGVTLSGGEPTLQAPFAMALARALRDAGVHVALETCAGVKWERLQPLVDLVDLVLMDIKIMDPDKHLDTVGVSLDLVMDNAKKITQMGKPLWIRTPVIPNYTDDEQNIRKIARFIKENLPTVERYEILAFNNLCASKYERLGLNWELSATEQVSEDKMKALTQIAHDEDLPFAEWSGMTKLE